MTFTIAQHSEQAARTHWRWSVWIDGPAEELALVDEVIWKLHPSFSPPEVRVTERSTFFRLDSGGWGEFEIRAELRRSNGEKIKLRQWLHFGNSVRSKSDVQVAAMEGVPPASIESSERQPKVFLSYTTSDAQLAGAVAEELKKNNVDVSIDADIPAGANLREWISERIAQSDATVFLLPDADFASLSHGFTGYELGWAQKSGKPIIPVLRSEGDVPEMLRDTKALRISGGQPQELDVRNIARSITDIVR